MTIATVALNGTNIETYGLGIAFDSWASLPTRSYQTVTRAGVPGAFPVSRTATVEPRIIGLKWLVQPTGFTDRASKMRAITPLFDGPVTITTADDPTIGVVGLLEAMPVTAHNAGQPFVASYTAVIADLRIVCHDPLFYDLSAVTQSISAGVDGTISMGTGPTRKLVITVNGPAVNPIVIVKDQSGNEIQRMTLTGTLIDPATATGSQHVSLAIDCDNFRITGTNHDATTFNAFSWLAVDETFPTLRLSSTVTGYKLYCAAGSMSVSHYRGYWS